MPFQKLADAEARLAALKNDVRKVLDEAGPDYDPKAVRSQTFADGTELRDWLASKNSEMDAAAGDLESARAADAAMRRAMDGPVPSEGSPSGSVATQIMAALSSSGMAKNVEHHLDVDVKAALFERGAGWAPETTRTGRVAFSAQRPAPDVADVFPVFPTSQAAVVYMQETVFVNPSAETGEDGVYPEAELQFNQQTVPVRKVAVWIPVTDEQLEDEPFAQALLEDRLALMLNQRVDRQLLLGDGLGDNLLGTANVVGVNNVPFNAAVPLFDLLSNGLIAVSEVGFSTPTAVFMSPGDWETLRLTRTVDGIYLLGNPADPSPATIWGTPIVPTTVLTGQNVAIAGDFGAHAYIAPRRGIDVQVSNSHLDNFTRGRQAIRMDVRLAVVHDRPSAFSTIATA